MRLDLHVKNVRQLFVKVYEINTRNYYRDTLRPVSTSIKLDGLVANDEQTHAFDDPPLRRISRQFQFPMLKKRGVYVIDFIGNGKSSRALIRKGQLRYLERMSTAGHVFTVLDESNRKLMGATLWHAGREYTPTKTAQSPSRFQTSQARQPIVLSITRRLLVARSFPSPGGEVYVRRGHLCRPRELLTRNEARVLVRPSLMLNGTPVTLSVLENVRLLITSRDRDGVATMKEAADFKLFEDRESTYKFQVPRRLASIAFELRAEVKNLSQNKNIDLATSSSLSTQSRSPVPTRSRTCTSRTPASGTMSICSGAVANRSPTARCSSRSSTTTSRRL